MAGEDEAAAVEKLKAQVDTIKKYECLFCLIPLIVFGLAMVAIYGGVPFGYIFITILVLLFGDCILIGYAELTKFRYRRAAAKLAFRILVPRAQCEICQNPLNKGDEVAQCPYCYCQVHRKHMLEWIKTHGTCPRCRHFIGSLE